MNWDAWGRYFVELLLCLPAGLLCLAPVKERLRVRVGVFLLASGGAITLFAAVGALVIVRTGYPENALLIPGMVLFFVLYRRLVRVQGLPAVFIFLVSAAVMGFCAVFTDVLLARREIASLESSPTWLMAGAQLGIGMLAATLFWPLMERRVGWLIDSCAQISAWRIVWLMPLAHLVVFIVMAPQDYHTVLVNRVQMLGVVVSLFLLFLLAFQIEQFYRIARSISDSAALREHNSVLAAQASQYAALNSYIQETRRLRHNFRQHLRVLSGLAAKGDVSALTAYLHEVSGKQIDEYRIIFANPSLNALAGYYDALARTRGVPMEWRVSLPETLEMPEAEMCVLLGNLLENAIEGATTLPEGERSARVICHISGDMLCLVVENGFDGRVRRKKEGFLSTKHPGEGYGLHSVRTTVARHRGSMSVETEGGVFRVSLLLNLPASG